MGNNNGGEKKPGGKISVRGVPPPTPHPFTPLPVLLGRSGACVSALNLSFLLPIFCLAAVHVHVAIHKGNVCVIYTYQFLYCMNDK